MTHWGESFNRRSHTLRVLAPDGTSRVLSLAGAEFKIGRSADNDLVLDDPCIAGHHCRLEVVADAPVLRDRGSRFGTTINHVRCTEPVRLVEGDRIGIGGFILEVVLTRDRIDITHVADRLRHTPALSGDSPEALLTRLLEDAAANWHRQSRPRRLLPDHDLLARAATHVAAHALSPVTRAWLAEATRVRRRAQALRSWALGSVRGAGLAAPLLWSLWTSAPPAAVVPEMPPPATPQPPVSRPPEILDREHRVVPGDTLASLANDYLVDALQIERWNPHLNSDGALTPGTTLRIKSSVAPPRRILQHHIVEAGDTWDNLASAHGVTTAYLRASNPRRAERLQPGERITWEAIDLGGATPFRPPDITPDPSTTLVPIPASSEYDLRCAMNAYATTATARNLLTALANLRARLRYRGQIVVGDLSREDGGAFGKHMSHQTGHDVDIWLPHRAGYYREEPGCTRCATPWCRPDLAEIDWKATWQLITSLRTTGAIKQIFLDRQLHDELREAARAAGVSEDEVQRSIPGRATSTALVLHADRHTRHIHVRFVCDPDTFDCGG